MMKSPAISPPRACMPPTPRTASARRQAGATARRGRFLAVASVGALVVLALAPLAAAGTQAEPEVIDASLDAFPPTFNALGDLTRGWLELVSADLLRVHIEIAAAPPEPTGMAYVFVFRAGEQLRWAGGAWAPDVGYDTGEWGPDGPITFDDIEGWFTPGQSATLTADVPLGAWSQGVTELSDLTLYAVELAGAFVEADFVFVDEAFSTTTFALPVTDSPDTSDSTTGGDGATGASQGSSDEAEGRDDMATDPAAAPSNAAGQAQETPGLSLAALVSMVVVLVLARRRRLT